MSFKPKFFGSLPSGKQWTSSTKVDQNTKVGQGIKKIRSKSLKLVSNSVKIFLKFRPSNLKYLQRSAVVSN
jgi:hypothetical protein